ncbi:MAG TPA: CBS domain-containing protein [Steroidobacteraceae bacterium]|jgi:CBS domain-containing protein|nr:CBS domain-containing protein [Steroidobacteraceae bacterium]
MPRIPIKTAACSSLQIPGVSARQAKPDDPALSVMTDFRELNPVTVSESATIDDALEHMKHAGVRSAFAIAIQGQLVVGLITAYDITGEKPMQHMLSVVSSRPEVLVRDIMQRVDDWQVVDIKDVDRAAVVDVARLFDKTHLTHISVLESANDGELRLRGLLSAARVSRLLAK